MSKFIKMSCVVIVLAIAAFVYSGCGSPVAPPTAPAEIPSPVVLKFVEPTDIEVDFSAIAPAAGASVSVYNAVGAGGEYSDEISLGNEIVWLDNVFLRQTLQGISQVEVPIGLEVTSFSEVILFLPSAGPLIAGERLVEISFADYDWDNDGVNEGCSGNTAQLPVCARMWIDGVRYLAWVFDAYNYDDDPSTIDVNEKNVGKGRFKVYSDFTSSEPALSIAIFYDRENPEYLFREQFLLESSGQAIHTRMTQTGPIDSAVKFLASTTILGGETSPHQQYLAQYREDQDFWSGSLETVNPSLTDFTNLCARLSTGNVVEPALATICDELGISVADIDFLSVTQPIDVAVPVDFAGMPTL